MANKKKQDEALAAVQAQTEEMHWQMPAISPVRR